MIGAPAGRLLGSTTPRLLTAPLVTGPPGPCGCGCALTPDSSLGFEAASFAEDVVGVQLLPWERWWMIHALEVRPDGSFRFKTVLTLIARQNGKTYLLKLVSLYFLYLGRAKLVLGAAQSLDIARESWSGAVDLAQDDPDLAVEIETIRRANGEQELRLTNGGRYRITAATRGAGRGLSVDLLILDELREHQNWHAWGALSKTTNARPNALIVGISNAGDDGSVVLNSLRSAALAGTDDTIGVFEWSAPDGCELDDRDAWAQANPALGYTMNERSIASALATDPPNVFRTEVLCQRVDQLDGAIDLGAWRSGTDKVGSLASIRDRVVACVDVAPDGQHVTACLAGTLADGRVRVEVLGAWPSTEEARTALPGLLERVKPAAVAWFPTGPGAALAPELRGMEAHEVKGAAVSEACMGLADLVASNRLLHPGDPLLDAHIAGAGKTTTGDGWRFIRSGAGHVDAAYAAAGAVYVARTLPVEPKKPRSAVY